MLKFQLFYDESVRGLVLFIFSYIFFRSPSSMRECNILELRAQNVTKNKARSGPIFSKISMQKMQEDYSAEISQL